MANYRIVSQEPGFEFVPPNKMRRVQEIIGEAVPSGVIFYFRLQPQAYNAQNVKTIATNVAEELNKDANVPGVVGIRIEQDVNANNQIVEMGVTTVESDSGNSTDEIRDVQTYLFTDQFEPRVKAMRAKLNAIEAGD